VAKRIKREGACDGGVKGRRRGEVLVWVLRQGSRMSGAGEVGIGSVRVVDGVCVWWRVEEEEERRERRKGSAGQGVEERRLRKEGVGREDGKREGARERDGGRVWWRKDESGGWKVGAVKGVRGGSVRVRVWV
jgi:hypothetical protein